MREREKVFDPGRPMIRENKYRVEFLRASASTTILMKNCGSAGGFSLIQDPSQFYSRRMSIQWGCASANIEGAGEHTKWLVTSAKNHPENPATHFANTSARIGRTARGQFHYSPFSDFAPNPFEG